MVFTVCSIRSIDFFEIISSGVMPVIDRVSKLLLRVYLTMRFSMNSVAVTYRA